MNVDLNERIDVAGRWIWMSGKCKRHDGPLVMARHELMEELASLQRHINRLEEAKRNMLELLE